ncbi:hypothetical protein PHYBLDRAFT_164098 [Phycomyces blakesleeanus NRRL 1555(-)]|uniref:Uncharacterized protein n=1 Tax=Phycomyces blakesleeanus (strain ATCC 8743b / DSM 1359 / FGSC 10004 / NBRC 33097 / NRRL 1555) TaxID=763407 RepID=A0A167Q3H4_PHYB8|nr:hypothetical protein PHYBLDRAFT_164098 [Phycomyces blakesleeanus NRRL 1555(-)]OAD79008.1 hypothetical protein PHYBLDRAFT_164098 [Phycomyces blakesleeanus NRRL 1555(-)]|eukprot:XP_018297048.1 hypothetical protein PHYBLDRAFT_164098 [Phycomyces blakesleeanus NRRL 1555(-)]
MYIEDLYQNDKIKITVFTINQHLLQHYLNMISAFGPRRSYSTRSVEHAIGKYSHAIKSNSAIGVNARNIMVWLAHTQQLLTDSEGGKQRGVVLYKGERAGADSNIEFWGPLGYKTIVDSFEDISCLPILIRDFYRSKGVECRTIEPAIITSCKAFINSCVIDSSFSQKTLREAHHIHLQMQVDLFTNVRCQYTPVAKDFFGKVILFFEHGNSVYNVILVVVNGQLKLKVVHLADVKELVGLVVSDATGNTTTTKTKYIVWPELNRSPKLNLALPAKVLDPPIGFTTTLGQANITTPQPSTTTSTTTNTRSYLDVATATPAPGQVPVVLFSNLPTSTDCVWHESISCHSVFFTPPTDSTLTSEFWTALRASVPTACTLGIPFAHRQLLIHELHLTNSTICTKLCSKGFLVGGQTYFPSMGIAPGTKILHISLSQLPYLPSPLLEEAIKTALAAYGTIHKVSGNRWVFTVIIVNLWAMLLKTVQTTPKIPDAASLVTRLVTCNMPALEHPPRMPALPRDPARFPQHLNSLITHARLLPVHFTDLQPRNRSPLVSANRFAALGRLTDNSHTGALFDPTLPLPQTHNTQYDPVFHPLHNAFLPSFYTSGSTKDEEEFHPSAFDGDNDQDSQNILTDDEMADGNHS